MYATVENFVNKHGFNALIDLQRLLNEDQCTHQQLATIYGLSRSRMTQIIESVFDRVYVLNDVAKDHLADRHSAREHQLESEKKFLKEQKINLTLIPGGNHAGKSSGTSLKH